MGGLRVAVDATPLIGRRTGVGRYVEQLVRTASGCPEQARLVLTGITVRGSAAIPRSPAWDVVARPFSARLAQELWRRGVGVPSGAWFAGRHQVFHGTNFVLPPLGRGRAGVVTVHDLAWLRFADTVSVASRALRDLVPRSIRRAALILVPSQAVGDQLGEDLGVPADRIRVTPLGVDEAWLQARPDDALARRLNLPERYVVVVATHEPRKNLPFLLAAHREACATESDTPPLVLVGGHGWGPEVEASSGRVRVTGFLPDGELRSVVAGACALALPSLVEGFGLPVLEAFAVGIPVLAADLPVLHEVSGGLAHVADPADRQAWAALLVDPPTQDPGPLRARAAASTWQACAAATLTAYRDAAEARATTA